MYGEVMLKKYSEFYIKKLGKTIIGILMFTLYMYRIMECEPLAFQEVFQEYAPHASHIISDKNPDL